MREEEKLIRGLTWEERRPLKKGESRGATGVESKKSVSEDGREFRKI